MARWARLRFALLWVDCFSLFLCVGLVVGLSDIGMSGVGLSDCRIALEMGFRGVWGCVRYDRAQKPHTSPTTPAPALKKIYTGRVNICMMLDALREKSTNVSVGGCLIQNMATRRVGKREEVEVGRGSGECEAGYETSNCGELSVRSREL